MSEQRSPTHAPYTNQFYPPHYEDEISLVDLGKIVYKQKQIVIIMLVIFTILALCFVFLRDKTYEYRTVIEVGHYIDNDEIHLIESPEATLARISNASIPNAFQSFLQEKETELTEQEFLALERAMPEVTATVPKDSGLVVLKSEVLLTPEMDTLVKELHSRIASRVKTSHLDLVHARIDGLEVQKQGVEIDLKKTKSEPDLQRKKAELTEQIGDIEAGLEKLTNKDLVELKLKRLKRAEASENRALTSLKEQESNLRRLIANQPEKQQLLERQLQRASDDVEQLRQSRHNVVQSPAAANQIAQSLLLIDSQIDTAQKRMNSIERALYIELPNETADLKTKQVELAESIGLQEAKISEVQMATREYEITRDMSVTAQQAQRKILEAQLRATDIEHETDIGRLENRIKMLDNQQEQIYNTRIQLEPFRNNKPVGLGAIVILAVGIMLGGIMGIILAFGLEFLNRVKQELKSS